MTTHSHAHIARHIAIVLAGAASLTLTVGAGAYVANQIGSTRLDGAIVADRAASGTEPTVATATADPLLARESFVLSTVAEPKPEVRKGDSTPAPRDTVLGTRLLFGDAYLDAGVAAEHTGTIAVTLGTNAVGQLTGAPRPDRDASAEATRLRTEFDTRSGQVLLLLTDPTLGRRDLRIGSPATPRTEPTQPGHNPAPEAEPAVAL